MYSFLRMLYLYVYRLPLSLVVFLICCAVLFWTILNVILNSVFFFTKLLNSILLAGSIFLILFATLFMRKAEPSGINLVPFYYLLHANEEPEAYRMLLMNMMLFVPFGIAMPFILSDRVKYKMFFTILFAFIFSIVIEILQYSLTLGIAETDDVICNTLGASLGTVSYWLKNKIQHTDRILTICKDGRSK